MKHLNSLTFILALTGFLWSGCVRDHYDPLTLETQVVDDSAQIPAEIMAYLSLEVQTAFLASRLRRI